MSIPEPRTTNVSNGTSNTPVSQGNISQLPGNNRSSVDRFAQAPASDGPYFAGARMSDRSAHINGLSSQLDAMDKIMKTER
ncbi:hypothetical protein N7457_009068 [Penicillium paradoxum]|uniref:uncharacterized protein n=1 Tax=Penicillium paradoxum TaxID=176176 RepID=UPI002547E26E|nr:uncharacterized protein N7457_009068 [Penicillium paradoxum]KAJ5774172.1 hypothetical protein N7457_009068 [Penicillium paradoxum]